MVNFKAWFRWARAFVTNRRQYRITGHYSEVPAVLVVDANGAVHYRHVGSGIGDYPPLDDVITAMEPLLAAGADGMSHG